MNLDARRLLEEMTQRVREAYILERRRWELRVTGRPSDYRSSEKWDGGENPRTGKRTAGVWPKVAAFVLEHRLEPCAFIRSQFEDVVDRDRCPLPNQLYNQNALGRWKERSTSDLRIVAVYLDACKSNVQLQVMDTKETMPEWSEREVWAFVLTDGTTELDPLFRYCMAEKLGLVDVADTYEESAAAQYVRDEPNYDEIWGDLIPYEFKMRARQVYREALEMAGGQVA